MKAAGQVVAGVFKEIKPLMRAGVCTKAIADKAEAYIKSKGATPTFKNYNGFPGSVCISVNDVIIHGIPSKRTILKEGDIVSVDVGATLNGYVGDACRTFAVGKISTEAQKLISVTQECFYKAMEVCKPGNRVGDISHAIQSHAEANGYSVTRDFTGHGLGREMHEDPSVPNFGTPGTGAILREGMTIAVEPIILQGRKESRVLKDGWTAVTCDHKLAAHYENSIVITKDGYEILTKHEEGEE